MGTVLRRAALLCAVGLITLAACIPTPEPDGPWVHAAPRPARGNPLAGAHLYVDAGSNARALANAWRVTRPEDAGLLEKIAREPQAAWFGEWSGNVQASVDQYVSQADGALPVLVVYDIPHRDCGQHSAGGAAEAGAYRVWIRNLAIGLHGRRAVVILEPDALGLLDKCLSPEQQAERLALLSDAVGVLAADPKTTIYLDAGHAKWVAPDVMASRLARAGVEGADGFALNVSNYIGTEDNVAYGKAISARLGGKHFVIDTSRNGNGPTADMQWCNPEGRALGAPPTTAAGDPLVDAFLWIKRPGESDGACNGGPRAGEFWPEQALGLARRAR
jgi:endoglucanase